MNESNGSKERKSLDALDHFDREQFNSAIVFTIVTMFFALEREPPTMAYTRVLLTSGENDETLKQTENQSKTSQNCSYLAPKYETFVEYD